MLHDFSFKVLVPGLLSWSCSAELPSFWASLLTLRYHDSYAMWVIYPIFWLYSDYQYILELFAIARCGVLPCFAMLPCGSWLHRRSPCMLGMRSTVDSRNVSLVIISKSSRATTNLTWSLMMAGCVWTRSRMPWRKWVTVKVVSPIHTT